MSRHLHAITDTMEGNRTNPRDWIARRWFTASGCLVAEAIPGLDPVTVFDRLTPLGHVIYLDSAVVDAADDAIGEPAAGPTAPRLGRSSFVAADPIHSMEVRRDAAGDPHLVAAAFGRLRELLADLAAPTIPGLPPFQGGVAGFLSYECGLEQLGIRPPTTGGTDVPLVSLHVYDVVFAYDHDRQAGWFISQGVPARGPAARRSRAAERLETLLDRAAERRPDVPAAPRPADASSPRPPVPAVAARDWITHPLPGHTPVCSTHSRAAYLDMVRAGIELVRAGDIFQVNLAQQFAVAATIDPVTLYLEARRLNPAPFAGFFAAGGAYLASMSPERFLQVSHGVVRMHPIKGTRRVIASPEADLYAGDDLETSGKDRAENVMIVDLVRNDLARACTPASVRVEALCRLERYRYVQHLVSIVAGRLRRGSGPLDAVEAAMPGGSVTGAPKHRACEIIAELEGVARGAYCGSLGYIGLDGAADFNLLIRTFVVSPGRITFAAGGGITAASDPASEYAESLHKAEGMLRVLASLDLVPPAGGGREPAT